jgi:hypothetical protein
MGMCHEQMKRTAAKICPKTGRVINPKKKASQGGLKWLFPATGLFALIWFLIRVIPKPDRANYPCMRVAFPLASTFVTWMTGLIVSTLAFRRAQVHFRRNRYMVAFSCLAVGVAAIYIPMTTVSKWVEAATPDPTWYVPTDANGLPQVANAPIGVGRGVYPGRVVWSHDPNATNWSGTDPNWWQDQYTDPATIEAMLSNSLRDLASEDTDAAAWDALFRNFNQRRGKGDVGYTVGEKIAIKVNFVHCNSLDRVAPNDPFDATPAPQLLTALVKQLVDNGNVTSSKITVYDVTKLVIDTFYDPIVNEFPDVQFGEWVGGDGRFQVQYDDSNRVWWSVPADDPLVGVTDLNPTYLPVCVTQADYIINLANMKGHTGAGITLCAKNHYGTILSGPGTPRIFDVDPANPDEPKMSSMPAWAGLHEYHITHDHNGYPRRLMGSYNPMVDIMGHPDVGEKTVLFLIDMLYTTHKQGKQFGPEYKWQSYPFNDDWCSSFLVSQDGVAIDSVGLDFMRNDVLNANFGAVIDVNDTPDNYMHEAALAYDPPSGAFYDPDGDTVALPSLGVHEHWNDPVKKQYTGNLKTAEGIELIQSPRLAGDITGAGVDAEDLAILARFWLESGCGLESNNWCSGADINHDTFVNLEDFVILSFDWGKRIPPERP